MYSFLYMGGRMKNRLEELRSQRGWTQQELADQVEVSRQTIISLENGRYNPSILLAFRLARLFQMPIEDLFLYSPEEENHE
jgi:putative transcriptional regulator